MSDGRIGYLDWARGLCVVLMIHMHSFFAWVAPEHRDTVAFGLTRLMAGFPGAVFLFLSGLSMTLAAEGARRKGASSAQVVRSGLLRSVEVLAYAFLFRLWMFTTSQFARPADLLRVDVLNCIAVALLLVALGVLGWSTLRARVAAAVALGLAIALATPLLWDNPALDGVPFALRGYLGGHHPDWIYSVFPWAGFAAFGAAAGTRLPHARREGREGHVLAGLAAAGLLAAPLGLALDRVSPALYPRYDFWYTSPNYFLVKLGVTLVVLLAAYAFDRLPGAGPLRQLGRTSLMIYWLHIEVVYGKWIIPGIRGRLDVGQAALGVVLLTLVMLALSLARTHARAWRLGGGAVAKKAPASGGAGGPR